MYWYLMTDAGLFYTGGSGGSYNYGAAKRYSTYEDARIESSSSFNSIRRI